MNEDTLAQVEYEIEERPVGAILGALALTFAIICVGAVPLVVGFQSEVRDPGGGYLILGALTGLGHLVIGGVMLFEVLFLVGTGRGKTLARLAHTVGKVTFMPPLDFMLGAMGVGFGTIYMFAFTQTIADLPRLPQYAIGYTTDGWMAVWIVWAAVLIGCFFWSFWLDSTLGRDPRPKIMLPEEGDEEEYY